MKSHPIPFGWTTRSLTGGEVKSEIDVIQNNYEVEEPLLNSLFLGKKRKCSYSRVMKK